jgi:hypothetical protein
MYEDGVGWDDPSGLQTQNSATVWRILSHIATLGFQA